MNMNFTTRVLNESQRETLAQISRQRVILANKERILLQGILFFSHRLFELNLSNFLGIHFWAVPCFDVRSPFDPPAPEPLGPNDYDPWTIGTSSNSYLQLMPFYNFSNFLAWKNIGTENFQKICEYSSSYRIIYVYSTVCKSWSSDALGFLNFKWEANTWAEAVTNDFF